MTDNFQKKVFFGFLLVGLSTLLYAGAVNAAFGSLLTADDPNQGAEFGRSVATDGNIVVVGAAEGSDETAVGPGAAYVFRRIGRSYVQEAKLTAPDPELGAEFGRAVAVKGNTIVVGARFASSGSTERAGAAYIYRKHRGDWIFEQKLTAGDSSAEDNFGRAVALDNNLIVVTARKEDTIVENDGSAYVFRRKGHTWVEESKLTAGDSTNQARFGQSVAVQGNLIVVGARDANTPVDKGAGAIYLFTRQGNEWVEVSKLAASDGVKGDQFAFSLAIDGGVIAVGARRADPEGLKEAGAVYLYGTRKGKWSEIAKLTASDAAAGDEFGHSVAATGGLILVGARRADIDGNKDQGTVYLFRQFGNKCKEMLKITAFNGAAGDEFAHSMAAHGNTIVVGANLADADEIDQGAAYVYRVRN
ncbi:MAG: FG-GAP repeat protein [Syntrophobacteraceae bacterium]